jgi:hypothetical protein
MRGFGIKVTPGASPQVLLHKVMGLAPVWLDVLGSLPGLTITRTPACCEIPETECPPHCVCNLALDASQGGTAQANIQVTNTGSATRFFTFSATPFAGPGNPSPTIQLSPPSANLTPGASVNLAASITVTQDFQPGGKYTAEIHIDGAYQQAVCVTLTVGQTTTQSCNVSAGDIPKRIRAHQWYDHFQCEELCAEPVDRG